MLFLLIKFIQKTKRDLELVSLPHFVHHFWRKSFLSQSIDWPNFIVWLLSLREILLRNIRILIVCFPGCDIINFEINLACSIIYTLIFLEMKGAKVVHVSCKFHLHMTFSSWLFNLQIFSYLQKAGVNPHHRPAPPPLPSTTLSFPLKE